MVLRRGLAILIVAGACLSGCSNLPWPFSRSGAVGVHEEPADQRMESLAESGLFPKPAEPSVRIVRLQFDVVRADMRIDVVQHSLKIWNHVDEFRVDPRLTALMARNGVRMGVGLPGSRSPMRLILSAAQARLHQQQYTAVNGLPLVLRLESMAAPETVFTYGSAGSLVGKTIPAGEKLLVLDYRARPELSGAIDLRMGMEIRVDRGVLEWRTEGGVLRQVPGFDRHRFDELGVSLTLQPGEFLVIGPSEETADDYLPLLGTRFFTGAGEGGRVETVLFITPSVSKAAAQ